MLSVFPELLSYPLLAPLLLRLTLGIILCSIGFITLTKRKNDFIKYFKSKRVVLSSSIPLVFGIPEILLGLFFIAGFYTQVSSIITALLLIFLATIEKEKSKILPYTFSFYVLLIVVAVSLLFSGAGLFAIDLPL